MLRFDSRITLPGRAGSDNASMVCWLVAGKSKRSDQRNLGLSVLTGVHPMVRNQDSTGSISTTDLLQGPCRRLRGIVPPIAGSAPLCGVAHRYEPWRS